MTLLGIKKSPVLRQYRAAISLAQDNLQKEFNMAFSLPRDFNCDFFSDQFVAIIGDCNALLNGLATQAFAVKNKNQRIFTQLRHLFAELQAQDAPITAYQILMQQVRGVSVPLGWHKRKLHALNLQNHFLYYIPEDLLLIATRIILPLEQLLDDIGNDVLPDNAAQYIVQLNEEFSDLKRQLICTMLAKLHIAGRTLDVECEDVIFYLNGNTPEPDYPVGRRQLTQAHFEQFHHFIIEHGSQDHRAALQTLPWGRRLRATYYYSQQQWICNPLHLPADRLALEPKSPAWLYRGHNARHALFADPYAITKISLACRFWSEHTTFENPRHCQRLHTTLEDCHAELQRTAEIRADLNTWLHAETIAIIVQWETHIQTALNRGYQQLDNWFGLSIAAAMSPEPAEPALTDILYFAEQLRNWPGCDRWRRLLNHVINPTRLTAFLVELESFPEVEQLSDMACQALITHVIDHATNEPEQFLQDYTGAPVPYATEIFATLTPTQASFFQLHRLQYMLSIRLYTTMDADPILQNNQLNLADALTLNLTLLNCINDFPMHLAYVMAFQPVLNRFASDEVHAFWNMRVDQVFLMRLISLIHAAKHAAIADELGQLQAAGLSVPRSLQGHQALQFLSHRYPNTGWSPQQHACVTFLLQGDQPAVIEIRGEYRRRLVMQLTQPGFDHALRAQLLPLNFTSVNALLDFFSFTTIDSANAFFQTLLDNVLMHFYDQSIVALILNYADTLLQSDDNRNVALQARCEQLRYRYYQPFMDQDSAGLKHNYQLACFVFVQHLSEVDVAEVLLAPLRNPLPNTDIAAHVRSCSLSLLLFSQWQSLSHLQRQSANHCLRLLSQYALAAGVEQSCYSLSKAANAIYNLIEFFQNQNEYIAADEMHIAPILCDIFATPLFAELEFLSSELLQQLHAVLSLVVNRMEQTGLLYQQVQRLLAQLNTVTFTAASPAMTAELPAQEYITEVLPCP